jgi:basic membrane protein A and related proteins
MKSQLTFRLLICLAVLALLAGCAPAVPTTAPAAAAPTTAPAAAAAKPLKVALILPGRADDVSWNQAAYEGMQEAVKNSKVPIDLKVVEQVYDPVAIEPALRDYAQQGYDLIVGHGFQFQEPIIKVAADFPKTNFAIGTGFKLAPNVGVYDVKMEQGGYLAGIIAGMLTKSKLIGAVGGVDVSEIHRGHAAFGQGVKSVSPDAKGVNNFIGDFNNLAGAKEGALNQMKAGADVIWQSGDGIGIAVLGACKEQKTLCFGNIANQTSLAPDSVISSFVYHWGPVYSQMIDESANKSFGNKKYWIEFANKGVTFEFNDAVKSKIPAEAMTAFEKAKAGFENNTLDLGDLDSVKLEQ